MTWTENVKPVDTAKFPPDVEDAIFCKRYAPRPGQARQEWPIVWEDDWCGEFEPEEQDE